jgi:integrase
VGHGGRQQVEPLVHVEAEGAVRVDVRPEQGGQPAPVLVRELLRPRRFGEDLLNQQRVYLLTELVDDLRQLTYHAAYRMFSRANAALGANWSLHDLRHTAAYQMARDPDMPLTDVQWILGHAHLSTTQLFTLDELADAHRRPPPPAAPFTCP